IVDARGARSDAATALRAVKLAPLIPRYREALALINGTSFHTGAAAVLCARAQRIVAAAQVAAAMMVEALRANVEAFDAAFQQLRPHPGQRQVAMTLRRTIEGSALVRSPSASANTQDAYTLRCIPQILGAVIDVLMAARQVVEIEINSVTDNPLFLVEEE